jgi:hypothetical protein
VLNAALRREPTGATRDWRGDAVAVAKRPLKAGESLDGEGGFTVYGKLMSAAPVGRCPAHRPGAWRAADPRRRCRFGGCGRATSPSTRPPTVRFRREMDALPPGRPRRASGFGG